MRLSPPMLVLLLVLSALVWLPPSPAVAAACDYTNPCDFDIATPMGGPSATANPGGKAEAKGIIRFTTVRHFSVEPTRVADVCNSQGTGDGLGAYLFVMAEFASGEQGLIQRHPTPMRDDDGCSNGSYYTGAGMIYGFERGRIIRVRVQIAECDVDGLAIDCPDTKWSAWKDNPFT